MAQVVDGHWVNPFHDRAWEAWTKGKKVLVEAFSITPATGFPAREVVPVDQTSITPTTGSSSSKRIGYWRKLIHLTTYSCTRTLRWEGLVWSQSWQSLAPTTSLLARVSVAVPIFFTAPTPVVVSCFIWASSTCHVWTKSRFLGSRITSSGLSLFQPLADKLCQLDRVNRLACSLLR